MSNYDKSLHILSAYLCELGLTISQKTVDEKSNEIPAMRELLMAFYHGSSVGGLTELKPFAKPRSNLKEPLVYMTSSRQLAAHTLK